LAQGNDLHSLLIKPIQRLPRYKLLLEQLQKTCDNAAAASAAAAAAAAVALVDEATIFINERKRDAGQPGRTSASMSPQHLPHLLLLLLLLLIIIIIILPPPPP
jgi:hypothetical protein